MFAPRLCTLKGGWTGKVNVIALFQCGTFSSDLQVTTHLKEQEALLLTEEASPANSSTPPVSPSYLSESPSSPTDAAPAETPSVRPRRRSGRQKPRPISDYAQLVSRKHCIPEEVAELHNEERTADTLQHRDRIGNENGDSHENCGMNRDVRRPRRVSVIGAVDMFPADAELKEDRLPSVSFQCFYPQLALFQNLECQSIANIRGYRNRTATHKHVFFVVESQGNRFTFVIWDQAVWYLQTGQVHRVSHVMSPCFHNSPKQANKALALKMAFCFLCIFSNHCSCPRMLEREGWGGQSPFHFPICN